MHIGVILGVLISMMRIPFKNVRCFKLLQNDRERRDMASMGFAAGVCAAFIAPVGGVVLALEEGISYGTKALTTNILFSSVITSFTSATIKLILIRQCDAWCRPQMYAFLAAGAHVGGTTRICLSLGIILLESSGEIAFGLPVFIVVITTKFVADMLTHPIYHSECLMKGMPFLERTVPPNCSWIPVRNIMNKNVVALPQVTTVGAIVHVLKNSKHNGFPVVDPDFSSEEDGFESYGQLLGLILRINLIIILKHRLYASESFEENLNVLRNNAGRGEMDFKLQDIKHLKEEEDNTVDLGRFMHTSPFFVQTETSFSTVYSLMAGLGMRHLLVVNQSNEVVGVVRRKDIAVHKSEITCCSVATKVVPLIDE
ncbi:H(+)/Cl(-) exchange transporter 7-like isoform X1 [Rhodnius prolixus]|uniref:H(+)/Cl(-) exchange transporter 7-like isoform X1 n=1 Tax=Rhodnius prolixus TaxID=13249 RepID=UPI003D1896D3